MTRFCILAAFVTLLLVAPEAARACAVPEGCPMYDPPERSWLDQLMRQLFDILGLLGRSTP